MRLIAIKPCSFNGQTFYIGDEIPSEFVINPRAQEKLGVIAIAAGGEDQGEPVTAKASTGQIEFAIPINQRDGKMILRCNEEQICKAAEIMQMTTGEAKEAIKDIDEEKILILINACDSRKTIKEATEAAASKLTSEENAPEEILEEDMQEESAGDE